MGIQKWDVAFSDIAISPPPPPRVLELPLEVEFETPPAKHPVELMKIFFFFERGPLHHQPLLHHQGPLWLVRLVFYYSLLLSPNRGDTFPFWLLIFWLETSGGGTFSRGTSTFTSPPLVKGTLKYSLSFHWVIKSFDVGAHNGSVRKSCLAI